MKCIKILLPLLIMIALPLAGHAAGSFPTLTGETLKAMIDRQEPNLVVIDARTPLEYDEAHIKGAINLPVENLEKNSSLLTSPKESRLIFYCNGVKCGKSVKAAETAAKQGYKDIQVYAGGLPDWEERGYGIVSGPNYEKKVATTKITPKEFKEMLDKKPVDFSLVDVREPWEFAEGHIPGAINIPVNKLATDIVSISKDKPLIIYCYSGARTYTALRKLQKMGYTNIRQVIFFDWKEAGMPVQK